MAAWITKLSELFGFDRRKRPSASILGTVQPVLEAYTRDRIASGRQQDPDGQPWKPLNRRYAKWKRKHRPGATMLRKDGPLLNTIRSGHDDRSVWVGSNQKYAQRMQAQRPWLGLGMDERAEIEAIVGAEIETRVVGAIREGLE